MTFDMSHPGCLFAKPNPSRQTNSWRKPRVLRTAPKFFQTGSSSEPGWAALKTSLIGSRNPRLTQNPAGGFAHATQDHSKRGIQISGGRNLHRDRLQQAHFFLGPPAFGNVIRNREQTMLAADLNCQG